jgi:hypothetical protein
MFVVYNSPSLLYLVIATQNGLRHNVILVWPPKLTSKQHINLHSFVNMHWTILPCQTLAIARDLAVRHSTKCSPCLHKAQCPLRRLTKNYINKYCKCDRPCAEVQGTVSSEQTWVTLRNQTSWADGVAQVIECLPSKHEALSSSPDTTKNK